MAIDAKQEQEVRLPPIDELAALLEKETRLLLLLEAKRKEALALTQTTIDDILALPKSEEKTEKEIEDFLLERQQKIKGANDNGNLGALEPVIKALHETENALSRLYTELKIIENKPLHTHIIQQRVTKKPFPKKFEENGGVDLMARLSIAEGPAELPDSSAVIIAWLNRNLWKPTEGTTATVLASGDAARFLEKIHMILIAQALWGIIAIISFITMGFDEAKKLEKTLQHRLNQRLQKGSDFWLSFEKKMVTIGISIARLIILGVYIGLTVAALSSVASAAAILGATLAVNLIQEFAEWRLAKNAWLDIKDSVEKLHEGLHNDMQQKEITITESLEKIEKLAEDIALLNAAIRDMSSLKIKLEQAVGRRNKSIYHTIGVVLVALTPLFPPLFFIGFTMLIVPVLIGAARYLDEKLNQGRLTTAMINSSMGQSIINASIYKKMFGDIPKQTTGSLHKTELTVDLKAPVEAPAKDQVDLLTDITNKPDPVIYGFNTSDGPPTPEAKSPPDSEIEKPSTAEAEQIPTATSKHLKK